jgi:hypothetical protein
MGKRLAGLVLVVVVIVAGGCGSSGGGSDGAEGGSGGGASGSPSSAGGGGGGCGDHEGGKGGVIRTFCDGSATARVDVGGADFEVGGGECQDAGDIVSFNAGVVIGPDFTGDKPDYVGANVPKADGAFTSDGLVTVTVDGESLLLGDLAGDHKGKAITFTAKVTSSSDTASTKVDKAVKGTLTC